NGSLRVVAEWATRRRRAETISRQQLQKVPAARTIAQLMTTKRDHLTKAETVTVAAIEQSVPMLADAHALVGRFHPDLRRAARPRLRRRLRCGTALRQAVEQGTRAIDPGGLCSAEFCAGRSLPVRPE